VGATGPVGQQRCWINAEKLAGPNQVLRTPYGRSADLPTYRRASNPQMVRKAPPSRTADEETLIHGEADRLIGGASTTTTQEYMSPREATAFLKLPSVTARTLRAWARAGETPVLAAQDGEELRCLILEAIDAGWCGPAAEVIARSLVLAADTRLSKVVRQGVVCSRMSRDETVMDTISWTWEALRESTGEIVGAGSP